MYLFFCTLLLEHVSIMCVLLSCVILDPNVWHGKPKAMGMKGVFTPNMFTLRCESDQVSPIFAITVPILLQI